MTLMLDFLVSNFVPWGSSALLPNFGEGDSNLGHYSFGAKNSINRKVSSQQEGANHQLSSLCPFHAFDKLSLQTHQQILCACIQLCTWKNWNTNQQKILLWQQCWSPDNAGGFNKHDQPFWLYWLYSAALLASMDSYQQSNTISFGIVMMSLLF